MDAAIPISWDFGFRRNLYEADINNVAVMLELLGKVCIVRSRLDKRTWELEDHGEFSCKSFRYYLSKGPTEIFHPFDAVWKAKSPPKTKFLVWLIARGKVNTCDLIQRRNPNRCLLPNWCVLCRSCNESIDHLFIHCKFTLSLWWNLLSLLGLSWVTPRGCYDLLSLRIKMVGKGRCTRTLKDCLVHALIWNVWLERNGRIFQGNKGASVEELWDRIKFWASLWASVSGHFEDYHFSVILRDMRAVLV